MAWRVRRLWRAIHDERLLKQMASRFAPVPDPSATAKADAIRSAEGRAMSADRYARVALECLDEIALAMERKWGVGRLPRLVDPALAAKFDAQRDKLNDAIHSERQDAIAAQAAAMERAWKALDAAAAAKGAQPLSPNVWEATTPAGEVIAIVRTPEEATLIARERKGAVWTVAEVAIALDAFGDHVRAVKEKFPGANVTAVRPASLNIGSSAPTNSKPATRRGQPKRDVYRRSKSSPALFDPNAPPANPPPPSSGDDFFDDEIPF
jgi:hypothetical protein